MHLSKQERREKLEMLVEIEGFESTDAPLAEAAYDSVCPGICTRSGCNYTREVEPDQDRGFCEECRAQTVASALILAEVI